MEIPLRQSAASVPQFQFPLIVSKCQPLSLEGSAKPVLPEKANELWGGNKKLGKLYRCCTKSILTGWFMVWLGNLTAQDLTLLQSTVQAALKIITDHPQLQTIYLSCGQKKAESVVMGTSHPDHTLHTLALWKVLPVCHHPRNPNLQHHPHLPLCQHQSQFLSSSHQVA